jgi:hypothetical protein
MYFRSSEDRLNPIAPADADESTLGGYLAIHGRSPGFTGRDDMPYTVAIESERPEDAEGAWVAYLVFLRWAENSTAIMGHLDSEDLSRGPTEEAARQSVGRLSLLDVKRLLDEAIDRHDQFEEPTAS